MTAGRQSAGQKFANFGRRMSRGAIYRALLRECNRFTSGLTIREPVDLKAWEEGVWRLVPTAEGVQVLYVEQLMTWTRLPPSLTIGFACSVQ